MAVKRAGKLKDATPTHNMKVKGAVKFDRRDFLFNFPSFHLVD